jgi:hypothetical protein
MQTNTPVQPVRGWRFALLCAFQIWVSHGIAFFVHEYAHSFLATVLGFKLNPWLLHFGTPTFANIAIMLQINENVNYVPIYAQGHGYLAALIAFAGFGIGNVVLYFLCLWLLLTSKLSLKPLWRLFFFWLCLMNVGNFYDYVPIRTFAHSGDIAYIVRGLGCSPWIILVTLGVPMALSIWHLFWRLFPATMHLSFPNNPYRQAVLRIVSICLIFMFYGGVGLLSDSLIANCMALASIFVAFCAIIYFARTYPEMGTTRNAIT